MKFENIKNIKTGDYVIMKPDDNFIDDYKEFIKTHIGMIKEVLKTYIYITFIFTEKDSREIKNRYRETQPFKISYIKYTSNNLEELEAKLNAEKYNL